MSEQKILNTITETQRSGNYLGIYTYYLGRCINTLRSYISNIFQITSGITIKENELFFKQTGLDDVSFYIDNNGNLIIKSNTDKDFSLNSDGELIMVENNSLCHEEIITLGYGALYNWPVTQDFRKISSSDSFIVPTKAIWEDLLNYVDVFDEGIPGWTLAGTKLKESGFAHWQSDEFAIEGTNAYLFSLVGSGGRSSNGEFWGFKTYTQIHANFLTIESSINSWFFEHAYDGNFSQIGLHGLENGCSIRLCNPNTLNPNGYVGSYTQNDGTIIPTIVINGVEWTMNLRETKFRDGSWITGFDGGIYTPISDANWQSRGNSGESLMCVYSDNLQNL